MKRLFLMAAAVLFSLAAMAEGPERNCIQVTGRAVKEFTPNEFYMRIVIDERDSKGKISVEEQQRQMIATLKGLGVNIEKQLLFADLSGEFFKRKTSVASATYQLKLFSAKEVAEVQQALVDLGLSAVFLERVSHSDIEKFKHEVRRASVVNARECAEELAEALGQKAGRCFYINDSNYDITPRYNNMLRMNTSSRSYDAVEAEVEEPSIDFKVIKIEYSVQARFDLV